MAGQFKDFGPRVREVRHGDALEIAGFSVHVHGQDHALIHRDIPVVENRGFLVDADLFHPGVTLVSPAPEVLNFALGSRRKSAAGRSGRTC